jgi:hypothetical protein
MRLELNIAILTLLAISASAQTYVDSQGNPVSRPKSLIVDNLRVIPPSDEQLANIGIHKAVYMPAPEGHVATNYVYLGNGVFEPQTETVEAKEAREYASMQANKPEKLKLAENSFISLCEMLTGQKQKFGFDTLAQIIKQMMATDPNSAIVLSLSLLAADAECKREGGNSWWDTAQWHEGI